MALLGFANGAFAVAAIGAMMQLAGDGRARREGTRMGLWGARAGAGRRLRRPARRRRSPTPSALRLVSDADAFAAVFAIEAALFIAAAAMALRIMEGRPARPLGPRLVPGE